MSRNRASAKKAGTAFERLIADYLATTLDDDRIDRRVKTGSHDRGDIAGLRHMGGRVVVECKNTSRPNLGVWAHEVEIERGNDDALAGIIIHKRHGKASAGEQWVTMTAANLVALLTGSRDHVEANNDQ